MCIFHYLSISKLQLIKSHFQLCYRKEDGAIFYVVYLIMIISAYKFSKSKLQTLIMLSFMVIIFGLNNHHLGHSNYHNMDFNNYYTLYLSNNGSISARNVEIGFKFLMFISNKIGLSFNAFRIGIALMGYIMIFNTIKKYSSNPNLVFSIYLIYPFINDVIQIRNFLAASIVVFSFRYLLESGKYNSLKYISGILIASTIHLSSLFYLIFIIAKYINHKTIFRIVFLIFPVLTIFAYTPLYIYLVRLFTDSEKILSYLSRRTTWGLFFVFGILFLFYFLQYYLNNECRKDIFYENKSDIRSGIFGEINVNRYEFYNMILKVNTLLMLTAPLLVYNFNFIRIYRNIMILNYIVFSDGILFNKKSKRSVLNGILVFGVGIVLFIFFYGMYASEQIFPVFNDNILL